MTTFTEILAANKTVQQRVYWLNSHIISIKNITS